MGAFGVPSGIPLSLGIIHFTESSGLEPLWLFGSII